MTMERSLRSDNYANSKWGCPFLKYQSFLLLAHSRCSSSKINLPFLTAVHRVVGWIHHTLWVLFLMCHNGHSIWLWPSEVFVGGPGLKYFHQSESLRLMTLWHLVKTECRYGGSFGIVPWHYLEQRETQRYVVHTWEKVTQRDGELGQIAFPSRFCFWSQPYVIQSASVRGLDDQNFVQYQMWANFWTRGPRLS